MFKKWATLAILVVGVLGLTGCGGGAEEKTSPGAVAFVAAAPVPAAGPVVADTAVEVEPTDVVLEQIETRTLVTPGKSSTFATFQVLCKVWERSNYCQVPVQSGQVHVYMDFEPEDIKLLYGGEEVQGWFYQDEDKNGKTFHRLMVPNLVFYRAEILEVVATVPPHLKTGDKSAVSIKLASASVNESIAVVSAESIVVVQERPHIAPVFASNESSWSVEGNGGLSEVRFDLTCPSSVQYGCWVESFDLQADGAYDNSEVQVYIDGDLQVESSVDPDSGGYVYIDVDAGRWLYPGEIVTIQILGRFNDGGVWVSNLQTTSGGEGIRPLLSSDCSLVIHMENCK